jgi:hypothetical protein
MCGPLKQSSQELLKELSVRMQTLGSSLSSTMVEERILFHKMEGTFLALLEQFVVNGELTKESDGESATNPGPTVALKRTVHQTRRRRR